jgi:hypothetical protein
MALGIIRNRLIPQMIGVMMMLEMLMMTMVNAMRR